MTASPAVPLRLGHLHTATLTTALTSGQSNITTLHVSPLVDAPRKGVTLTLMTGNGTTQSVTLSANSTIGCTTLSVNAFTASNAYPANTPVLNNSTPDYLAAFNSSGTLIFDSNWVIEGASNQNSDTLSNNVPGATGAKFNIPTDFNGIIYLGTGGGSSSNISCTTYQHAMGTVVGYGLLFTSASDPDSTNAPMVSPSALTYTREADGIHLSWTQNSSDQAVTEIDRSTDNSNWTVLQYVPTGVTSYLDAEGSTEYLSGYYYRVRAVNGPTTTAFSSTSHAPAVLLGDANFDGKVSSADLTVVLNNFGSSNANWSQGNFSGTPTVGLTDMGDVLNNLGQTSPITGVASGDPAPAATPSGPTGTDTGDSGNTDSASNLTIPSSLGSSDGNQQNLTPPPTRKVHRGNPHTASNLMYHLYRHH